VEKPLNECGRLKKHTSPPSFIMGREEEFFFKLRRIREEKPASPALPS
jgi:hypothetical protein